jgi:hypothetical protein
VERGRKEMAPIVDTVAHLPTLSVPGSGSGTSPLQGGDLRPGCFGSGERHLFSQSTTPAPESLPWRGEKKRGRKELAPGEDGHSVPSSCPSPSGEGTRGPGVRAGPLNQAPGPKARSGPLAVRRLGSGKRLPAQSKTPASKSLPWRGEKKGRPEGGHPAERGRKELAPGEDGHPVPSSCPSPS